MGTAKPKKTIHEKLAEVQEKYSCPKDLWNDFSKFKYRSCEGIISAAKPLLKEYKLLLTLADDIVVKEGRFYFKATATLRDLESQDQSDVIVAEGYAREEESKKGMDAMQISGCASSYARKYALNALFLTDDGNDADGQDNREHETKPTAGPSASTPAQPGLTVIKDVTMKKGVNPPDHKTKPGQEWTKYTIVDGNDKKHTTFNKTLAELAKKLMEKKAFVLLELKTEGRFENLVGITEEGAQEELPEFPPTDEGDPE